MAIDMDKLNAFVGQFVGDLGATVHAGMVVIGERLGLYKALAAQPVTSAELASKTKTDERYVREWLASQAAGRYVTYDEKTNKFSLPRNRPLLSPRKTARLICLELSNWHWDRLLPFHESPIPSAPALEWAGTNITTMSFTDARNFSDLVTLRIW